MATVGRVKIGELARKTGVSVRALRYYDEEGLIRPGRGGNGYRDFCDGSVEAVLRIRGMLDAGLNFRHRIHLIGLHLGVLIEHAPGIFADLLDEVRALIAAGVCAPGTPTVYGLSDGPKALAELEARAAVGKLVLRP